MSIWTGGDSTTKCSIENELFGSTQGCKPTPANWLLNHVAQDMTHSYWGLFVAKLHTFWGILGHCHGVRGELKALLHKATKLVMAYAIWEGTSQLWCTRSRPPLLGVLAQTLDLGRPYVKGQMLQIVAGTGLFFLQLKKKDSGCACCCLLAR